jgi:uncharacterized SAM-dependent methyltransferase
MPMRARIRCACGALSPTRSPRRRLHHARALHAHRAVRAGLGYYVAGSRKFGRDGRLRHRARASPLFGGALARQVGAILRATGGRDIVELGAGSGALAADLLHALAHGGLCRRPTRSSR